MKKMRSGRKTKGKSLLKQSSMGRRSAKRTGRSGGSGLQDGQKAGKAYDIGGKESVKGNRQGSLSRSIKPFFKLFQSLKNALSVSKRLF